VIRQAGQTGKGKRHRGREGQKQGNLKRFQKNPQSSLQSNAAIQEVKGKKVMQQKENEKICPVEEKKTRTLKDRERGDCRENRFAREGGNRTLKGEL